MKKICATFFVTLFLYGCTKEEKVIKPQPKNTTMTQTLRVNNQGDLTSLNPHKGVDLPCRIYQKALFEGLTRLDENEIPQLALAERYEVSPSQLRYIFYLRPSKWTNGEAVKAMHFEQAWKKAIAPNSNCLRADLFYPIKNAKKVKLGELPLEEVGVKALDDQTLVIDLENPTPYLFDLLANPLFSPLYETENEPTVFNGPFLVATHDHEKQMVLQKNPNYWDCRQVYLDQIDISFIHDPNTAIMMYEKGELDWVGAPFTLLPIDSIKHAESSRDFAQKSIAGTYWLCCNTEQFPLNSIKIRKALSTVLDREEIAKHVLMGERATKSILPPSMELLKEEEFYPDKNIKLAQTLFDEGLQELNITRSDLPSLQINHSDIAGQKKLAETLQQVWEKAFGIKIELVASEWNTFFTNLTSKKYQISGCIWFSAYNDPIYNLDFFKDYKNRYNASGWVNKQYQQLLDLAEKETDITIRKEHLKQAERLVLEEMPIIPIYTYIYKYLVSSKVQGINLSSLGQVDFKGMYIKEKVSSAL